MATPEDLAKIISSFFDPICDTCIRFTVRDVA